MLRSLTKCRVAAPRCTAGCTKYRPPPLLVAANTIVCSVVHGRVGKTVGTLTANAIGKSCGGLATGDNDKAVQQRHPFYKCNVENKQQHTFL